MKGSRYNLFPIQFVPDTIGSRYNLFPIQYVPDTVCSRYSLFPIQFVPDTICADTICADTNCADTICADTICADTICTSTIFCAPFSCMNHLVFVRPLFLCEPLDNMGRLLFVGEPVIQLYGMILLHEGGRLPHILGAVSGVLLQHLPGAVHRLLSTSRKVKR